MSHESDGLNHQTTYKILLRSGKNKAPDADNTNSLIGTTLFHRFGHAVCYMLASWVGYELLLWVAFIISYTLVVDVITCLMPIVVVLWAC